MVSERRCGGACRRGAHERSQPLAGVSLAGRLHVKGIAEFLEQAA
jgi:hypothetical protein